MIHVLFIHWNKEYHYPITSTQMELLKIGVRLECCRVESREQALQQIRPCDLLVVDPKLWHNSLENLKNPVALASKLDGGLVSPHVKIIPRVAGTIESYAYIPRSIHNLMYWRYTQKLLADAGFENRSQFTNLHHTEPNLSQKDLKKIHVFCGFGSWERMQEIAEPIDLRSPRTIPVHFAGTTAYQGTEIEAHRKRSVYLCRKLGGVGLDSRQLRRPEYHRQLLKSKAVLSPWGWGEACHRDFEALAKGCVLIKPDWSHVESFPNCSSHEAPYIPCRHDLTDVPRIVDSIENDWTSYRNLRERGLQLVSDAINKKKNAEKLKEIFEKILN